VRKVKVAIIGGGLSGLTLAIALRQRGRDVTVYERVAKLGDEIGAGISTA
jgi:salicylate hydroxylase